MTSSSAVRVPAPLRRGAQAVVVAFAVSGTVHLVRPQVFEPIVPRVLPGARRVVLWSGVAELACAAGMLLPRTRRAAGPASAALLVAVLPANVQMAVDSVAAARRRPGRARLVRAGVTVARLPLQWPLVRWAAGAGR